MRKQRTAAAVAFLLVLALQCFELRAELLFRSATLVDGEQHWSAIRNYGDPSDTAPARRAEGKSTMPAEDVRVFLSGAITRKDIESAGVMAGLLRNGRQRLAGNSVWLASNGGDIDAAMALGRLLRELGVFTVVGKDDQCLSACVFAFMGGERRIVAGRLGIHRPFFPFTQDFPDRQVRFRHLQRTLKDYFEEMDFPASLYEAVMLVPPETMKMLTPAELKRFYLEGISPSTEDVADAAAARHLELSMFEYLQRKAKAPACAFPVVDQGRCDAKTLEAAASRGTAENPAAPQQGEASAVGSGGSGDGYSQGSGGIPRGEKRGIPGSS